MTGNEDFALKECREAICAMQPGQRVTIIRDMLSDVVVNPFTRQSPVDRVLEGIVGSSYSIRHWMDPATGNVTFERVKEDGRKWHEPDPGRRHWFKRGKDGALYPAREQNKTGTLETAPEKVETARETDDKTTR